MDLGLAGKTALITGASKGIGLAVAHVLARRARRARRARGCTPTTLFTLFTLLDYGPRGPPHPRDNPWA